MKYQCLVEIETDEELTIRQVVDLQNGLIEAAQEVVPGNHGVSFMSGYGGTPALAYAGEDWML